MKHKNKQNIDLCFSYLFEAHIAGLFTCKGKAGYCALRKGEVGNLIIEKDNNPLQINDNRRQCPRVGKFGWETTP